MIWWNAEQVRRVGIGKYLKYDYYRESGPNSTPSPTLLTAWVSISSLELDYHLCEVCHQRTQGWECGRAGGLLRENTWRLSALRLKGVCCEEEKAEKLLRNWGLVGTTWWTLAAEASSCWAPWKKQVPSSWCRCSDMQPKPLEDCR